MTESGEAQSTVRMSHPRGLLRWFMRAPIALYRLGLGRMMGGRFLMLEHRGRKTGALRRAVIEVVDHDPDKGSYVVAAAWGRKSDWYMNISAAPQVTVTVRSRRFAALARTLPEEEARLHLRAYSQHYPTAFRQLGRALIGEVSRDTEAIIERFVNTIPFVEFVPRL